MSFYEIVFITRPDIATDKVSKVAEKIGEIIKKQDGKVVKTEEWGLRTLAYRIRKYPKGYYTMLCVDMPGAGLTELERNLNLSEDIIRFSVIKVDELSDEPSAMMRKVEKDRSDAPAEAAAE